MILDTIAASKAEKIAALRRPRKSLAQALKKEGMSLIGEIKKASPSEGVFSPVREASDLLERYLGGGIRALSVVTEPRFFAGDPNTISDLRQSCPCPILRKDFLLHPLEICESYLLGADAVLLIAALLEQPLLEEMLDTASGLGLECLVEVHTREELDRVLDTPARIVGINNRNLQDFSVSLSTTEKLVAHLRHKEPGSSRIVVSESGISRREDVAFLEELGVQGMLVGTALVRSADPEALIRSLLGTTGEKAS